MTNRDDYRGFRFNEDRQLRLTGKSAVVVITIVVFLFLWWALGATAMFWPMAIVLPSLAWVASFGWRQAVIALIRFLERLTF